jgi:hypothetical protein
MKRIVAFAVCLLFTLAGPAFAEHFDIVLTVETTVDRQTAVTDPIDKPDSSNTTPTFTVTHDEPLVLQFFVTNVYPHGVRKNVDVHYWIAPMDGSASVTRGDVKQHAAAPGAAPVLIQGDATPDAGALLEGRFTLNFKPKGKVGIRQHFRVHQPGRYLIRVQSERSQSDHEHFSQLVLVVE